MLPPSAPAEALAPHPEPLPEGMAQVSRWMSAHAPDHTMVFLARSARTAQEAADTLGVALGQIAKSIVFMHATEDQHVLIVTSGDQRVDEAKVAARLGGLRRAKPDDVRARSGYAIGGVAPVAHRQAPRILIDAQLRRFEWVWTAAGHPQAVFAVRPATLAGWLGAEFADVTVAA